jgi:hypothetical protein
MHINDIWHWQWQCQKVNSSPSITTPTLLSKCVYTCGWPCSISAQHVQVTGGCGSTEGPVGGACFWRGYHHEYQQQQQHVWHWHSVSGGWAWVAFRVIIPKWANMSGSGIFGGFGSMGKSCSGMSKQITGNYCSFINLQAKKQHGFGVWNMSS